MPSCMSGLSPTCHLSQSGSEARVWTPGGTGAGLTGHPGATPNGTTANLIKMIWEWVMKIVSPSTAMPGQGSGGMFIVTHILDSSVA